MQITEYPYTWYMDSDFPNKRRVRDIAECTVWMTGPDELTLLLLDPSHGRAAVFEYDNLAERDRDIRKILLMPGGGGASDSGIGARIRPRPPGRSGSAREPLPEDEV